MMLDTRCWLLDASGSAAMTVMEPRSAKKQGQVTALQSVARRRKAPNSRHQRARIPLSLQQRQLHCPVSGIEYPESSILNPESSIQHHSRRHLFPLLTSSCRQSVYCIGLHDAAV